MIGRIGHVTILIQSSFNWLTGPKIGIVSISFAELEMDFIYCYVGGVNINFNILLQFYDS